MTPPEVHYVPPVTRGGYITQAARWFVSRSGWGRRFASREEAVAYAESLWGEPCCAVNAYYGRGHGWACRHGGAR